MGIVRGQKVDVAKVERARELRRRMTRSERALWQQLRANKLQGLHFRRQQVIDGFIVDFYCHAAALVVEVDGPVHLQDAAYDADRDRILSARGLQVLRFSDDEVERGMSAVLARILEVCVART
ncbi:MAG: endonuclease domain-containing protein [Anaerolineae bacterium]